MPDPTPETCPRCGRAYRFREEIDYRLCATCVLDLSGFRTAEVVYGVDGSNVRLRMVLPRLSPEQRATYADMLEVMVRQLREKREE